MTQEMASPVCLPSPVIKTEPCEIPYDTNHDTVKLEAEVQFLYADHEIKEEIVIGPTEIHPLQRDINRETVEFEQVKLGDLIEQVVEHRVKVEEVSSLYADKDIKSEPCEVPVYDANPEVAVKQSLYVDQEIKEVMVIRPNEIYQNLPGLVRWQKEWSLALAAVGTKYETSKLLSCRVELQDAIKDQWCAPCKQWFSTAKHLAIHRRIHRTGQLQCFTCEFCGMWFLYRNTLAYHRRVHLDDRKFQCNHCDKRFIAPHELTIHLRTVTERPFACDQCNRRFAQKDALSIHKRIHSGKRFVCNRCDKKFRDRYRLLTHRKTHSDVNDRCKDQMERAYACDKCKRRFAQKEALLSHKLVHRGRRFRCNQCDKSYSTRYLLAAHKQKNHTDA